MDTKMTEAEIRMNGPLGSSAATPAKVMYRVEVSERHKAWDSRPSVYYVRAVNGAKAISAARRNVWADGTYSKQDGALSYKATKAAPGEGEE
jgi:hypothetical protein